MDRVNRVYVIILFIALVFLVDLSDEWTLHSVATCSFTEREERGDVEGLNRGLSIQNGLAAHGVIFANLGFLSQIYKNKKGGKATLNNLISGTFVLPSLENSIQMHSTEKTFNLSIRIAVNYQKNWKSSRYMWVSPQPPQEVERSPRAERSPHFNFLAPPLK